MKLFGWILAILGLLGCLLAAFRAVAAPAGVGVIAIAIAGVGGLFAGIWLIERH